MSIGITGGSAQDFHFLDQIAYEVGSIYVFDRGYNDFGRLYSIYKAGAFFVIRAKANTAFYVCKSRCFDKSTGLRCDQVIRLNNYRAKRKYSDQIRRISFVDSNTGKRLVFLTNHFGLPALTVTLIYKSRWKLELLLNWTLVIGNKVTSIDRIVLE